MAMTPALQTIYLQLTTFEPNSILQARVIALPLPELKILYKKFVADVGPTDQVLNQQPIPGVRWSLTSRALLRYALWHCPDTIRQTKRYMTKHSYLTIHDALSVPRAAPLAFDLGYRDYPGIPELFTPGNINSRFRMVSDDTWHLLGCSSHPHGWHDVDGHVQVMAGADDNSEDRSNWDDNCLLIYTNKPDPWQQVGHEQNLLFRYYGLHYDPQRAGFTLRQYTGNVLPALSFDDPATLSKEIKFLRDYEVLDRIEHPMDLQVWKQKLHDHVTNLSQCYIGSKQWLGVAGV